MLAAVPPERFGRPDEFGALACFLRALFIRKSRSCNDLRKVSLELLSELFSLSSSFRSKEAFCLEVLER